MAAKDRERGNELERWVARRLGLRRRSRGEHGGYDDCVEMLGGLAWISIECKAHAKLQLRSQWIAQAIRNAVGRPWALVQRPLRSRRVYVTVDFDFFEQLLVEAGRLQPNRKEQDEHGSADAGREAAAS